MGTKLDTKQVGIEVWIGWFNLTTKVPARYLTGGTVDTIELGSLVFPLIQQELNPTIDLLLMMMKVLNC